MDIMRWGTWEELLLGGAVLRHGTRAWDAVAAELRARSLYPYCFTSEACKAKYEDVQERYSDCTAWFEELRKQRVAQLKRELEESEDSIGSLETKLESLKTEKGQDCHIDYDSCRTESLEPMGNSDGVEFSAKETSKDGLSAGSYTEETRPNWSRECQQIPAGVSSPLEETDTKPELSYNLDRERATTGEELAGTICDGGVGSVTKRRRGKRKRKDCNNNNNNKEAVVKEGSVGENDVLSSAIVVDVGVRDKEELTGDCDQSARFSSEVDDQNGRSAVEGVDNLIGILDSVMANDDVKVFQRRQDSQKRVRYNKTIRRHLDLEAIRSRIDDRSIKSSKELLRDLLLLVNNALVYYAKESHEYKSALSLRDMAKECFRRDNRNYSGQDNCNAAAAAVVASVVVAEPPACSPPVKHRSIRPCNRKLAGKVVDTVKIGVETPSQESEKACHADSPVVVTPVVKRGVGRPVKARGRGSGWKRPGTPASGRKRTRVG